MCGCTRLHATAFRARVASRQCDGGKTMCGRSKETLFLRRPIISQSDAAWRRPEIGSSPPLPLPVVRGQPSSLGNEVGLVSILTPSFSCTFGYTFPLFLSRCQTTMVLLSGCASLSTEAKRIPVDMVTCSRSTASAFHRHSPRVVPQPLPAGSHINWHTVGRDLLEAQLQGSSSTSAARVPGLCQRACLSSYMFQASAKEHAFRTAVPASPWLR